MANSKGPSTIRSMIYNGKISLLPPKSPFPSIPSGYIEYIPSSTIGSKALPQPRGANSEHQRTSSESVSMEEQPSWLDDLLNEPETHACKGGHRRSSSDSFAYIDTTHVGSMNYIDPISSGIIKNKKWDTPLVSFATARGHLALRDNPIVPNVGSLCALQDADRNSTPSIEKQDPVETSPQDPKGAYEKKDISQAKSSSSETDTKRVKQQFAQRSRVRKLQYIAELESNVQALQANISDLCAELKFLDEECLILSMENKALKKRLASLAQEQLIKYLENEVLEREVGRLQSLYQQQTSLPQQQQEPSPGRDSIPGQLHI